MKTITEHIRDHLLLMFTPRRMPDLPELFLSEWSPEFELLMRNRLIVGAFRYGRLNESNKPQYDRISGIIRHARQFEKDRNKEHLIDIANIALCEFVEGKGHFKSVDDGFHVKKKGE